MHAHRAKRATGDMERRAKVLKETRAVSKKRGRHVQPKRGVAVPLRPRSRKHARAHVCLGSLTCSAPCWKRPSGWESIPFRQVYGQKPSATACRRRRQIKGVNCCSPLSLRRTCSALLLLKLAKQPRCQTVTTTSFCKSAMSRAVSEIAKLLMMLCSEFAQNLYRKKIKRRVHVELSLSLCIESRYQVTQRVEYISTCQVCNHSERLLCRSPRDSSAACKLTVPR